MENRRFRFRSRSESPTRMTQTEEVFISCKEWVKVVKKVLTGVREQIDVYQILLEYDETYPPTYLIQGLLKTVTELEGSENEPKAPIQKGKTKDRIQNVKKNTQNRMDEDRVKDLLHQFSQQGNKNRRVATKHHNSRNSTKTSKRMVGNESGGNNFVPTRPRKSRQIAAVRSKSKRAELQVKVKVGSKKSSASPSITSYNSTDTSTDSSSSDSSTGGSTPAKRARAGTETVTDSSSSTSSTTESSSDESSSSSNSTSISSPSSAPKLAPINAALNEKRNVVPAALAEPKVLRNIFKFLPYNDLLTCRSVDLPLWSSEAEYSICHRPLLIITMLSPKIKMVKMVQRTKTRFLLESFEELSSKLENDEKGYEIWLEIVPGVSLQESIQFTTKFSSTISKLSLWFQSFDKVSPSDLRKLLVMLPNLSHLHLDSVPILWRSEEKTFPHKNGSSSKLDKSCLLPQVKTVSFGSTYSFFPELLISLFQMTPNLNNIHNFPFNCIPNSTAHDHLKIEKIRSVDFLSLKYTSNKEVIEKVSRLVNISQNINLQRAHFPGSLDSCWESWSRILENNKSTLETLKIKICPLSKNLQYPEMKAVKKLWLYSKSDGNGKVVKLFGKNGDVGQKFPNLMEVTLESESCTFAQFCRMFPKKVYTKKYFQGVTTLNLKFNRFWNLDELEKVVRLFPGVTKFYMNGVSHWLQSRFVQVFQLWPKLTSLKLRVNRWIIDDNPYFLDLIFTGLSAAKCNELRKHKEKVTIDAQRYRENISIVNMTDLKELILIFDHKYAYFKDFNGIPLISHVAAFYGFQCVPDLKVTFAIPWDQQYKDDIRKMLSPIEEYVNFNPNYADSLDYDNEQLFS